MDRLNGFEPFSPFPLFPDRLNGFEPFFWPCNDLWNLLPARPAINTRKGDRLPSASGLMAARERIVQWWHDAYLDEPALAAQFAREARGALPAVDTADGADPEAVFDALMLQRAVLWRDQRLGEWSP